MVFQGTLLPGIGIMLTPFDGDAQFSNPVTLVIPVEKIETYIELIRTAQQRLPKTEGGVV